MLEADVNALAAASVAPVVDAETHATHQKMLSLIVEAKEGRLPRDREPLPGEPARLNDRHIALILDRVAGYTPLELAERHDYAHQYVCQILAHPDSQTLISSIQAMQSQKLLSMEQRFAILAPQALNTKVALMNDPGTHAGVRDRIATDILDRAGYAPKRHEERDVRVRFEMPAQAATGLRAVLEESNRVAEVDYSKHLRSSDADVVASHMQLGNGQPKPADGAPPVPASGERAEYAGDKRESAA